MLGFAASLLLGSCSKNQPIFSDDVEFHATEVALSKERREELLSKFASVLSKASFENESVRSFLKKEALKQFDKNYDVLYYLVKDELLVDKSFRDELISHSSKEFIEEIERNIPLLNILVPSIAVFDINPEDLDVSDQEIPVAFSKQDVTTLYLDGKEIVDLEKGEVPAFHVFVVNENSRVEAPIMLPRTKNVSAKAIKFKSPNYDSRNPNELPNVKSIASAHSLGWKAVNAYSFYNQDDGSESQMAFQRDYIYYGIKPGDASGSLNH